MKEWKPAIYIMTNKRNGTLYTGVTNNLLSRVYQHKQMCSTRIYQAIRLLLRYAHRNFDFANC
jgi:predicted GIY-YIG superfamily endonuclease